MTKALVTLTNVGIVVLVSALVVVGFALSSSNRNREFLDEGSTRDGRVVSRHEAGSESDSTTGDFLRVKVNLATKDDEVVNRLVEVQVPSEFFENTQVGSKIPLLVLPGDPPTVRLKTKTEKASFTTGYLLAAALAVLGVVLIWLDRREAKPLPPRAPRAITLPGSIHKVTIKTTDLYDGPFEFSYAEEKTRIALGDGTSLRINQYRPLSEIADTVPADDLLEILRTAKSDWTLPQGATAKSTLAQLAKQKQITAADQFFINRDHLGLLFRDEVSNGRWVAWVRGVWLLSPGGRLLAGLLSANPACARQAAEELLYHDDLDLISSLAPHADIIQKAASGTPVDKRMILSAARLIKGLNRGDCACQTYTETTDFSPELLLAEKKMKKKRSGKKGDKERAHDLACTQCDRVYTVTAKVRGGEAHFQWEELAKVPSK